jgi:hypothetical protein
MTKAKKYGLPITNTNSIESTFEEVVSRFTVIYQMLQPDAPPDIVSNGIIVPLLERAANEKAKLVDIEIYKDFHTATYKLYFMQLFQGCEKAVAAVKAELEGNIAEAWQSMGAAQYHLGFLEASYLVEPIVAGVFAFRGKAGAAGRSAKYEPLRQFARERAQEGNFQSRHDAAHKPEAEVIQKAKELEIEINGKATLWRRIDGWLKDITFSPRQKSQN